MPAFRVNQECRRNPNKYKDLQACPRQTRVFSGHFSTAVHTFLAGKSSTPAAAIGICVYTQ
jgi:hypothetical protein